MADDKQEPPTCIFPDCGATMVESWSTVQIMGEDFPRRVAGPWVCPVDRRHPSQRVV